MLADGDGYARLDQVGPGAYQAGAAVFHRREAKPWYQDGESYERWMGRWFPNIATSPLAPRHRRLWGWFEGLEPGKRSLPKIEIWPRGGAKSSTVEMGTAYLGSKGTKRFCLYVCGSQDQANKHVGAIGTNFEKLGMERAVGKYANSKGWNMSLLRTATGFNVVALGLDAASRGIKLDEFRPDLIVFDDVDDESDSPKTVQKKIRTLSSAILPTGSFDVSILGVQNLIWEDSIFAQLADDRAQFLLDREVGTIEPACIGLEVERVRRAADGRMIYRVIGGTPTWEGQDLQTIEWQINSWGYQTFLREAQHEVKAADGLFFDVDKFKRCSADELPADLRIARGNDLAATQGGGDFTASVLEGYSPSQDHYYVLDAKREQYGSNDVRNLIQRSASADLSGIVYAADKKARERGPFEAPGPVVFRFKFVGRPILRLPQDPGQAGKAQADQFKEDFGRFELIVKPVSGSKSVRARGLQEQVNSGNVTLVEGDWNEAFIEEYRKFREDEEHERDDQVDAGADAFDEVYQQPAIVSGPMVVPSSNKEAANYQPMDLGPANPFLPALSKGYDPFQN